MIFASINVSPRQPGPGLSLLSLLSKSPQPTCPSALYDALYYTARVAPCMFSLLYIAVRTYFRTVHLPHGPLDVSRGTALVYKKRLSIPLASHTTQLPKRHILTPPAWSYRLRQGDRPPSYCTSYVRTAVWIILSSTVITG